MFLLPWRNMLLKSLEYFIRDWLEFHGQISLKAPFFIPSMCCLANNTLVQLVAMMLQLQFSFLPFHAFLKINHHHLMVGKER